MSINVESQATLDEVVDRLTKVETQIAGMALGQLSKEVTEILVALADLKDYIGNLTITIRVNKV